MDEEQEEDGDDMKLTSIQSITDFMTCAGRTMPDNIRLWARRNLAVARSNEVSPEERRHAQRALTIMMNIQWKNNYFEAIDPRLCVSINSRTSGQLLRIIDGTHIKSCPRKFQNTGNCIGNLRFSGSCRSHQKQSVCRKCMCAVNLNDRLNDSLLYTLHAIQFLI